MLFALFYVVAIVILVLHFTGFLARHRLDDDFVLEQTLADLLRVAAVVGQPLQVGNQYKLAVRLLERHALAQRSDIVAKVQRAGWAVAGEDSLRVHKDSLTL